MMHVSIVSEHLIIIRSGIYDPTDKHIVKYATPLIAKRTSVPPLIAKRTSVPQLIKYTSRCGGGRGGHTSRAWDRTPEARDPAGAGFPDSTRTHTRAVAQACQTKTQRMRQRDGFWSLGPAAGAGGAGTLHDPGIGPRRRGTRPVRPWQWHTTWDQWHTARDQWRPAETSDTLPDLRPVTHCRRPVTHWWDQWHTAWDQWHTAWDRWRTTETSDTLPETSDTLPETGDALLRPVTHYLRTVTRW